MNPNSYPIEYLHFISITIYSLFPWFHVGQYNTKICTSIQPKSTVSKDRHQPLHLQLWKKEVKHRNSYRDWYIFKYPQIPGSLRNGTLQTYVWNGEDVEKIARNFAPAAKVDMIKKLKELIGWMRKRIMKREIIIFIGNWLIVVVVNCYS